MQLGGRLARAIGVRYVGIGSGLSFPFKGSFKGPFKGLGFRGLGLRSRNSKVEKHMRKGRSRGRVGRFLG